MKRHLIIRIIPLVLSMFLFFPFAATQGQSRIDLNDEPGSDDTGYSTSAQSDDETILPSPDRSLRIVGGDDAQEGAWPFMAALVTDGDDPYNTLFCGGSLIDPEWVVTTAHCVEGEESESITVLLGIYDLQNDTDYDKFTVKTIISHYSYDSETQDNDIALLELTSAATAYGIIPIISSSDPLEGVEATVIGWGDTSGSGNEYPSKLQEVSVPIISNQVCRQAYGDDQITENMLCAGEEDGGKDACRGDSGGPLVVPDGELAGIVSWGEGCGKPSLYGVYARVSRFKDFLGEYVSTLSAPAVVTEPASEVKSNSAVLNGSVNPNGNDTVFFFEYGITTDYGSKTVDTNAGSGTGDQPVSATMFGLFPNNTYNYRISATNSNGTSYGSNRTFMTTGAIAPSVTTNPATSVTSISAVINGAINPNGVSTTYYFEYGMTTGYGSTTPVESAGSNTSGIIVTYTLTGLNPGSTYHYRVVGESSIGKSTGDDHTFTTMASQPPASSGGGSGGGCYVDTIKMGLDIHTSDMGWLLIAIICCLGIVWYNWKNV